MVGAKFKMLIFVNCLLALLLGCSLSKSLTSGSSLASEAELEGQKSIERYVTKCEGSYVTDIGNGEIDQWKPANIEIKPEQLTDADKLNGVEWKGLARVSGTAWRKYWPGQGWSNWFPPFLVRP